jgi:hypothetical protein
MLWRTNRKRASATAQSANGWGARRRLGFERMEGRLMLSGDAPDFHLWETYSPEFQIAPYPLGEMPLKTFPADHSDGGFILPGTVLSGHSVHGTFDPVTNRAHIGSFAPSTPTSISGDLSVSGASDFDFGEVFIDTPPIPPIAFPGTDSDPGTTFVDQPADAVPQVTETFADEGGAIPINSILAFVGHADGWSSGERLASKATSHTGNLLTAVPNLGPPGQARDIAGEWARPTMLEMAGGEPASTGHDAAHEHEQRLLLEKDAGSRVRRPLSSGAATDPSANDSRSARDFDGSRRGADSVPSEGPDGANGRSRAASQQPESLILASQIAAADLQGQSSAVAIAEFTNVGDPGATTRAVNESAYAEVYEKLGAREATGAEALFNRDSWRDWWKATPILMILALERIAASNSASETRSARERRAAATAPAGCNRPVRPGLKRG